MRVRNVSHMGTIVQTTELSDEKITSISPELAVDSLILVRQFVEWQLERHNLKFGLVVPNTGIMATVVGRSDRLPKVFLPDYLVNQNKDKIVERSRQGCTVVFSSMNTGHEVIEFFEGFHFSSSGTSKSELE